MSEAKKKLFGLFKSKSVSEKSPHEPTQEQDRRSQRNRPSHTHASKDHPERKQSVQSQHIKSESRRSTGDHNAARPPAEPSPALKEWPPSWLKNTRELSQGKAMNLITPGAPVFRGHKRSIPHASAQFYHLYATCDGNGGAGSDCGDAYTDPFLADSFSIHGSEPAIHPWETLEQPSMSFCYGTRPGEITLNHWLSLSGKPNPPIELRDSGVKPRDVTLAAILERLIFLEGGFEDDYEELMYKNLYKTFLRDPERIMSPHKGMEKQIADLITVLSRPGWIDFSRRENQVVAKFFFNSSYTDEGRYKNFFHQLLLSMELDLRIHSKHHMRDAKEKLLCQLPPCIAWDLAVARKWRECMKIEKFGEDDNSTKIRFKLICKKPQVKALRKFSRAMRWPSLAQVDEVLKERDPKAKALENRSSDTMSYFTGMVLPGVTLPWLIMNSLIDCDADVGIDGLSSLTHMHPNSGFQYKSTTYWSSTCIVGKVLAPTCREIGGWIGPARPAPDLERTQIARIRQRRPKLRLTISDVESMQERSDPLGPPSETYPIAEYELPIPEIDPDHVVDTVRIEKLALKAAIPKTKDVSNEKDKEKDKDRPLMFDAAVQFAIAGQSWPLRLSYDVSFISACPCARGPHPLFFDYVYKSVKVDEILTIRHWGNPAMTSSSVGASSSVDATSRKPSFAATASTPSEIDENEAEKVLVIEAFGVPDNEVLARAWCAHWALGAVVADMERTCMACAIREAYAACLNVVILIEGTREEDELS